MGKYILMGFGFTVGAIAAIVAFVVVATLLCEIVDRLEGGGKQNG